MKKTILMMLLGLFVGTSMVNAQTKQESKDAKKQAKVLKKEGWLVNAGAQPIERQLEKSYHMQNEMGENGYAKYIVGEGRATAGNYNAAKKQAEMAAKQEIAGRIQTEIAEIIETSVANSELDQGDAASVNKIVSEAKGLITNSIGRTISVVEMYRVNSKKNTEVTVHLAYSEEMARAAAKKAIQKDLEEQGAELRGKLDKALGW